MNASPPDRLAGTNILITRARQQGGALQRKLEALGANVHHLPMIEILPPDSWQELDTAIANLSSYDWVIFASVNAVHSFCERLDSLPGGAAPRFATIGPVTSAALKKYGLQASYQAPEFIADSFVENFPDRETLVGKRILWPKTNIGRMLICDALYERGARVDIVNCYKTALPANAEETARQLKSLLDAGRVDVIMVASSQTAKNMRTILNMVASEEEIKLLLKSVQIMAIGPQTAASVREQLFNSPTQAEEFTIDGMIEALLKQRS